MHHIYILYYIVMYYVLYCYMITPYVVKQPYAIHHMATQKQPLASGGTAAAQSVRALAVENPQPPLFTLCIIVTLSTYIVYNLVHKYVI